MISVIHFRFFKKKEWEEDKNVIKLAKSKKNVLLAINLIK